MKRVYLPVIVTLLIAVCTTVMSQEEGSKSNNKRVITFTEINKSHNLDTVSSPNYKGEYRRPQFRKGWSMNKYKSWVYDNLTYPEQAKENESEGRVVVAFVIEVDGSVKIAKALESPDTLLSNQVIRLVKSKRWKIPAMQWNHTTQKYDSIRIRSVIPVNFDIPVKPTTSSTPLQGHLNYDMIKNEISSDL